MAYVTPQSLLRAPFLTGEKRNADHMQFLRNAKRESEQLMRDTGKPGIDDDDFTSDEDRLAFFMRRGWSYSLGGVAKPVSTLLRVPFIEEKPKKVYQAKSWRNTAPEYSILATFGGYRSIVNLIKSGSPLTVTYYRQNMHNTPDDLLAAEGIMHLHPLGPGTSELIFLMQYDDYVLMLECSDHDHFRVDPPGTSLRLLHESSIVDAKLSHERRLIQEIEARSGFFGKIYQNDNENRAT